MANPNDDEKERTLWCGNLHPRVTEEILYELFLQAGPLEKVKLVKNKNYAFITFKHAVSVPYTIQLMNGIRLYGKFVQLQIRTGAAGNISCQPTVQNSFPFTPSLAMMPSTCPSTPVLMITPPRPPLFAQEMIMQDKTTAPYHRSISQPNFSNNNNQNNYNEAQLTTPGFLRNAPGKSQQMVRHTSHRPNLPYMRNGTAGHRFERNAGINAPNLFHHQPAQPSVALQFTGMTPVPWSPHQRRF